MICLLAAMALVQQPTALSRTWKAKERLSYHIDLTVLTTFVARHSYTMQITTSGGAAEPLWPVDVVLKDLKSEIDGKKMERSLFGAMKLSLGPTGFPEGLSFLGDTIIYSLPLLAFYLPPDAEKPYVASPTYDSRLQWVGTSTCKDGAVTMDLRLVAQGEDPDLSALRKLHTSATFEKNGTLLKSSGRFVMKEGTINFRSEFMKC